MEAQLGNPEWVVAEAVVVVEGEDIDSKQLTPKNIVVINEIQEYRENSWGAQAEKAYSL